MKRIAIFIGFALLFTMMVGCAGMTRLEMDYGTSYNLAKYNQIWNPNAEKNLEPVQGMDGPAAAAAVDKYRKGFESSAAAPSTSYMFNIGTTAK